MAYHLDLRARFHDGEPIKASDVVYTFTTLQQKGSPHYKHLYADVSKVEAIDDHQVRFTFSSPPAQSLVLRLSQLRVLPEHYWQKPH